MRERRMHSCFLYWFT